MVWICTRGECPECGLRSQHSNIVANARFGPFATRIWIMHQQKLRAPTRLVWCSELPFAAQTTNGPIRWRHNSLLTRFRPLPDSTPKRMQAGSIRATLDLARL